MKAPPVESLEVATYRVPTDEPESDGTLTWDHTDVIVVHLAADGSTGLGWTYAASAAADMIQNILGDRVIGQSAMAVEGMWAAMSHSLRNAGLPGAGLMAVAAVDIALWDLKAKLLGVSLVDLFGAVRRAVPIYGSGGFTSYTDKRLIEQLGGWAAQGIGRVKMKVGRDAAADLRRVRLARETIGPDV
jgi:L-alanine-DL-glutamate epimerase-like enolase superfamily enzyme